MIVGFLNRDVSAEALARVEDAKARRIEQSDVVMPAKAGIRHLSCNFSVSDSDHLLSTLRAIDVFVPKRTKGRKTEHVERYAMCRLLSTLAKTNHLSFPLTLEHRDSPDFKLECNGRTIGVEVTEATSKEYCDYRARVENKRPDHFIESSHFRFGKTLTEEEQRRLLQQDKLTGIPWGGDEPEEEWRKFITEAIGKKNKKATNEFQSNWLLIYENAPVPILNEEYIYTHVGILFDAVFSSTIPSRFDKIMIESRWVKEGKSTSSSWIIVLSSDGVEYFSVEDVWRKTL